MDTITLFKQYARKASYHYADDSCKEWHLARENVFLCRDLYAANPALQREMGEMVLKELWPVSELVD